MESSVCSVQNVAHTEIMIKLLERESTKMYIKWIIKYVNCKVINLFIYSYVQKKRSWCVRNW